jgi:hypothetical protein
MVSAASKSNHTHDTSLPAQVLEHKHDKEGHTCTSIPEMRTPLQ